MKALEVEGINTFYGSSHILFDLSFHVSESEVVTLLGRNGAGKTTIIRSIMGLTPPSSGVIKFREKLISGLKPHQIFREGIKIVPQGRGVFPALSVEENLKLAMFQARVTDPEEELEKVFTIFPVLRERRRQKGGSLSGGELQMLAISRALLGKTDFILMDEPSEGLAPLIIQNIQEKILTIKRDGTTILLAEQNAKMALEVGDKHYIVDKGRIRFEGTSDTVRKNEEIKRVYLGIAKR
jgi:branched-chain amino acid transport system ATP-binding protein